MLRIAFLFNDGRRRPPMPSLRTRGKGAHRSHLWMTKFHVTVVLNIVPVSVTYSLEPRPIGRAAAGRPQARGECGARARTCNPLPGGIGHQPLGTTTGARYIAGLG